MKNKGFTLIELLAVILILGIIALIAIPTVNNVIKQARIGANDSTVKSYVKAAEEKCQMAIMNKESFEGIYDISELFDMVKGDKNLNGYFEVDSECNVQIVATSNNTKDYCFKKAFDDDNANYYETSNGEACIPVQKEVSKKSCFEYENDNVNGGIMITNYLCGGKITNTSDFTIEKLLSGDVEILSYTEGTNMDVVIPGYIDGKKVTSIGPGAFSILDGTSEDDFSIDFNQEVIVNSVSIPSTVKTIYHGAFIFNKINTLYLSEGVENIMEGAFSENDLRTLYIPNSVKDIKYSGFSFNKSLSSVLIGKGLTRFSESLFTGCNISGEFIIPDNIVEIGEYAFSSNKISGTLVINDNIKKIGEGAFQFNPINKIVFNGNSLPDLGYGVFHVRNNSNLTTIVNNTGKKFIWSIPLFWHDDGNSFETGTIKHLDYNEITITKD